VALKGLAFVLLLATAGGCALTPEQLEALRSMSGKDETPEIQITIVINDNDDEVEVDTSE
jgi:hypothetical protein